LQEPTLWAMGVEHALKAIVHGAGSYKKAIPWILLTTSRGRIDWLPMGLMVKVT